MSDSRVLVVLDGVYSHKCEPLFTLYPRRSELRTLADCECAFRVFLRDTAMTRLRIERRLAELREQEERGRALTRVASFPLSNRD